MSVNDDDEEADKIVDSPASNEATELAQSVAKYLGRSRQTATIGDFSDFATTIADGSENYEVSMILHSISSYIICSFSDAEKLS
jgi:hypothetical protein